MKTNLGHLENIRWKKFRREILCERNFRCQICKIVHDTSSLQGYLHCHHIIKVRLRPDLKFDKSNILLVCQDCHKKIEGMTDRELLELLIA